MHLLARYIYIKMKTGNSYVVDHAAPQSLYTYLLLDLIRYADWKIHLICLIMHNFTIAADII